MPLRLGCDVDGVLANCDEAFQNIARRILKHNVDGADPEEAAGAPVPPRDPAQVWRHIGRASNWWVKVAAHEPFQIERLYTLARERHWEVFFLTRRPSTAGDTVQFQTAWWLEAQGFYLPAVLTAEGSRGELASGLRLDLTIDDRLENCLEVIGSSQSKAILLMRGFDQGLHDEAIRRGIGVVRTLEQALDVAERLDELLTERPRGLARLADWFTRTDAKSQALPANPPRERPIAEPTAFDFDVPDIELP